jgi:hypothetical protein
MELIFPFIALCLNLVACCYMAVNSHAYIATLKEEQHDITDQVSMEEHIEEINAYSKVFYSFSGLAIFTVFAAITLWKAV